jgi:hypothetical protein
MQPDLIAGHAWDAVPKLPRWVPPSGQFRDEGNIVILS